MKELFWQVYDWTERTFWNSLTRKLMSFLLLFLIDAAYLAIYISQKNAIADELRRAGAASGLIGRLETLLDHGLYLMIVLTCFALAWNVLQIPFHPASDP